MKLCILDRDGTINEDSEEFVKSVPTEEEWKGKSSTSSAQVGAMTGLGLAGGNAGLAMIFQGSKKVIERGFVPDLNDSVWLEAQAGWIFFIPSGNPFTYSAHLRWDFVKDGTWTLYGIGGFGGLIQPISGTTTSLASFYPRTALGAAMNLATSSPMQLRIELSQTWTTAGITFVF